MAISSCATDQRARRRGRSERTLTLDLALSEAEALRTWLMKPAKDGTTSLDDPLVSHALAKLGTAIDTVLTTVNVRHELQQAGLAVEQLTDEQVSELRTPRRSPSRLHRGIRN